MQTLMLAFEILHVDNLLRTMHIHSNFCDLDHFEGRRRNEKQRRMKAVFFLS